MSIITLILAGIVALEHLYIMYLETFATHSEDVYKRQQLDLPYLWH